jgi:hypothetical protein
MLGVELLGEPVQGGRYGGTELGGSPAEVGRTELDLVDEGAPRRFVRRFDRFRMTDRDREQDPPRALPQGRASVRRFSFARSGATGMIAPA